MVRRGSFGIFGELHGAAVDLSSAYRPVSGLFEPLAA